MYSVDCIKALVPLIKDQLVVLSLGRSPRNGPIYARATAISLTPVWAITSRLPRG